MDGESDGDQGDEVVHVKWMKVKKIDWYYEADEVNQEVDSRSAWAICDF